MDADDQTWHLATTEIPQANNPERLLELAWHIAHLGMDAWPATFAVARHRDYYLRALQLLGALDAVRDSTPVLYLLAAEHAGGALSFGVAFANSGVGRAWVAWQGVGSIAELDQARAPEFLLAATDLAPTTALHRASTLRGWLQWSRRVVGQRPLQLDLFTVVPDAVVAPTWPEPARFPHNEDSESVRAILASDLRAESVLMVVGYASLTEIIHFLATQAPEAAASTRILFGNEPFAASKYAIKPTRGRLADEVRDYWLERGVSILLSGEVLKAREAVVNGGAEIRIAPTGKGIHAKIYATPLSVTVGSSNFTPSGLGRQSEANVRFTSEEERFQEASLLGESLWRKGTDYREGFLQLLDALLRGVTWREALARGCAEILEGHWARRYVPPGELEGLNPPLWPHQLQGLSQAIWTLHNLGSVLVADATGSGKTRMGAWLLRAAHDYQIRNGMDRRIQPVLLAPPPVVESWQRCLQEAGLRWQVDSHGPLSKSNARSHDLLVEAIEQTELLAVDEAHNFVNPSGRTRRLQLHYANNVVLFTATPINRGATDLLGIVELLGADNFPDSAIDKLKGLHRMRRLGQTVKSESDLEAIRREIRQFLVRRTRSELNGIAAAAPAAYQLPNGRKVGYPKHVARYYPLEASRADVEIAAQIVGLAEQLKGVSRLGRLLDLPPSLAQAGMSEEMYLKRVLTSVTGLARYTVLDCLRSSRAALIEHLLGTAVAIDEFAPGFHPSSKSPSGNTIAKVQRIAGEPPKWAFAELARSAAPEWLWEPDAHKTACREEEAIYHAIAALVRRHSSDREAQKVERLAQLAKSRGLVIGFDSHLLSLGVFAEALSHLGVPVDSFTSAGGAAGKRRAVDALGLHSKRETLVALCSDALSEGMNMQGAAVVMHLDTPTVIRVAEQRAGRVDRMDSRHETVEIWWPKDPAPYAPAKRDLLRERHEVVSDLIGANLKMPEEEPGALNIEYVAAAASVENAEIDPAGFFDAFRSVREMVGGPRAMMPLEVYEAMRTSQADVISCVSLVRSDTPWAFFAVAGAQRIAPRWVLLDSQHDMPIADLAAVAESLRARLTSCPEEHPLDDHATQVLAGLVKRLEGHQRLLLPIRKQRALALADRVLPSWAQASLVAGDVDRSVIIREILRNLAAKDTEGGVPDLRALADAWIEVVRPVQRKVFESRRHRLLWRLDQLRDHLINNPAPTGALQAAFHAVPMLPPVSERIVAAIIGVPGKV